MSCRVSVAFAAVSFSCTRGIDNRFDHSDGYRVYGTKEPNSALPSAYRVREPYGKLSLACENFGYFVSASLRRQTFYGFGACIPRQHNCGFRTGFCCENYSTHFLHNFQRPIHRRSGSHITQRNECTGPSLRLWSAESRCYAIPQPSQGIKLVKAVFLMA